MEDLKTKKCRPCELGGSPLSQLEINEFAQQISDQWETSNNKIKRRFTFADFKEAIDFVNQVAGLAEEEGHHPDIHVSYNLVDIELWTHAVDGLSENDFILAAKIDHYEK